MFILSTQGAVDVIAGSVPLSVNSSDELLAIADRCFRFSQPRMVIDLSAVAYIDSRGLEALLELRDRCDRLGGECKLAGPNRLCQDALEVTGVASDFDIAAEVVVAAGSFVL